MPFGLEADPDQQRWRAILDQIEAGRIADVTPEALAWFCDRTIRLEQRYRQLRWRVRDAIAEDDAMTPQPAVVNGESPR